MKEEQLKTLTGLRTGSTPMYLGPCDTFSIPARCGCQALTVIEAEEEAPVEAMRRESSLVARKLYKRHYAIWVN